MLTTNQNIYQTSGGSVQKHMQSVTFVEQISDLNIFVSNI